MPAQSTMNASLRLLVVEDDEDLGEELLEALEEDGYEVELCTRGEQAVHSARSRPFDMVVTDIRMGGMDGLDALEQVRSEQPDLKSLVITGYSTEDYSLRAMRLGVSEYLKKPFRLETFLEAVRRIATQIAEKKQGAAREREFRDTALRTAEALARSLEPSLVGSARLAARLAGELGLTEERVWRVQLAALLGGTQRASSGPLLAIEKLPPGLLGLLRDLQDGGNDSLEARVVALALEPPASLEGLDEGLVRVWESVRRMEDLHREDTIHREEGRPRRSLLSLGRAFEHARDYAQAQGSYQELCDRWPTGRERVEALLGMARIARALSRSEEGRTLALRAWDEGKRLGPVSAGESALEAGLLLSSMGLREGPELLATARQTLKTDADPGVWARAVVGSARYGVSREGFEEAVQLLLRPEHRVDLVATVSHLLPCLLDEPEPRALTRIAREFPQELQRCVQSGNLSARAQLNAVRAAASGGSEAVLRLLLGSQEAQVREAAGRALQELAPTSASPLVRLYSLGPLEVYQGEKRVAESTWKSQKVRYLLPWLASQPGRHLGRERIVEEFWPDSPDKGNQNLYSVCSGLRKVLSTEGGVDCLLLTPQGLALNQEFPLWHDLDEVRAALEAAEKSGQKESALGHYRRALRLYRAPFLEGCYMEWALDVRNQTDRAVLEACAQAAALCSELGRHEDVLEFGQRTLELDPCYQRIHQILVESNLALGRPEEAIRTYEQACKALKRELGVEPSIELMRAHQRALLNLESRLIG